MMWVDFVLDDVNTDEEVETSRPLMPTLPRRGIARSLVRPAVGATSLRTIRQALAWVSGGKLAAAGCTEFR